MKPFFGPTYETIGGKLFKTVEEATEAQTQEIINGEIPYVVRQHVKSAGLVVVDKDGRLSEQRIEQCPVARA